MPLLKKLDDLRFLDTLASNSFPEMGSKLDKTYGISRKLIVR